MAVEQDLEEALQSKNTQIFGSFNGLNCLISGERTGSEALYQSSAFYGAYEPKEVVNFQI